MCRGVVYKSEPGREYRRFETDVEDMVSPRDQWKQLIPNLLAVSKQVRAEAVGYLYKQRIVVEDTMALHTFLAAIGQFNRGVLSEVVVKDWGCGRGAHKAMNVAALTALSTCTNLKKLNLDCRVGWQRTPKQLARQIFRDGHYFLEAFGAANGRRDAAVDVIELSDCNLGSVNESPGPEKYKCQYEGELRKLLGS